MELLKKEFDSQQPQASNYVYMKIYTKTGDQGTTRLVDGTCVDKFNPRVEAYGTVDELNSAVGFLVCLVKDKTKSPADLNYAALGADLLKIQHWLFNAGSLLATEKTEVRMKLPQITNLHILFLEGQIDLMTEALPELRHFILPGGDICSAQAHLCRTICRRAERRSAEVLVPIDKNLEDAVLVFLNRLSDYFFTIARYLNSMADHPETTWNKEING